MGKGEVALQGGRQAVLLQLHESRVRPHQVGGKWGGGAVAAARCCTTAQLHPHALNGRLNGAAAMLPCTN